MSAPFTMTRRVLFHETDLAGVMHFSNYFRLMEEVEHAWWRALGRSVHQVSDAEVMSWPRVSASCQFNAPVQFEDELELRLTVAEVGTKSLTMRVDFAHGGDLVASGEMRSVCCRMEGGRFKAVTIPAELREKLAVWMEEA